TFGRSMSPTRSTWFGLAAVSAIVLGIARSLTPDPSGLGTHLQLGLPRCGFLALTGLPCPACGLTTAFAHMARGEIAAAASVNAFGVLLFALTCIAIPLAVWAGVRELPPSAACARLHAAKSGSAL